MSFKKLLFFNTNNRIIQQSEDLKKNGLLNIFLNHIVYYPTSTLLTYFWSFGSLAGIFLVIQILSGVFLAMHYQIGINSSFDSIEHIMRDVNYGWFIRYGHSNGASFFFFVVYLHIAKGLYFKSFSYENRKVWLTGILLFVLMMASAFLGYILPWGQMSFWGATVITNFFSTIPYIGEDLVFWIWGGFSVNEATLNRFFSLHYLLPLLLAASALIHLFYLHANGSSNSFMYEHRKIGNQFITFYPYFFIKDLVGLIVFLSLYFYFIAFKPDVLGHSDNYIPASSLVTPEHIVPEWYFLPFYTILRSIPSKLGGVILMGLSIVFLGFLPYLTKLIHDLYLYIRRIFQESKNNALMDPLSPNLQPLILSERIIIFLFFFNFLLLGWLGGLPAEEPYTAIGQKLTITYFLLLMVLPLTPILLNLYLDFTSKIVDFIFIFPKSFVNLFNNIRFFKTYKNKFEGFYGKIKYLSNRLEQREKENTKTYLIFFYIYTISNLLKKMGMDLFIKVDNWLWNNYPKFWLFLLSFFVLLPPFMGYIFILYIFYDPKLN